MKHWAEKPTIKQNNFRGNWEVHGRFEYGTHIEPAYGDYKSREEAIAFTKSIPLKGDPMAKKAKKTGGGKKKGC